MTLTNHTIATLSKFAIKARKDIGVVKAFNMINDPKYACDLLIQATLSENDELVTLTKEISNQLNIGTVLINAIETYINDIKIQGVSDNIVHESKHFLTQLAQYIYGIDVDGGSYRQAVKAMILDTENDKKTLCINLARNFYRYWSASSSSVIHEQTSNLNIQKEEFIKLWQGIDDEFLYALEDWLLNSYIESMQKIGISESHIDIRQKIAKVIIIELRKVDTNNEEDYRNTINRVQTLFSSPDMQDFFLIVSREFYHFWTEPQTSLNDDTKFI